MLNLSTGARLTDIRPQTRISSRAHIRLENISPKRRLFTGLIEDDEIIVELFVPSGADASLEIFQVNKGFISFGDASPFKSGSCNNDVVCPVGAPWQNQIRSVARYSINGTALCSGTLRQQHFAQLHTLFPECQPLRGDERERRQPRLLLKVQSPNCGDLERRGAWPTTRPVRRSRASNAQSDFLLVELSAVPDTTWNVYFSGWDASGAAANSTVGIHHPSGDEKAISFNTNAVTSTAYTDNTVNGGAHYWRVDDWEDGHHRGRLRPGPACGMQIQVCVSAR